VFYPLYRRSQGLDLTSTYKVEMPRSVVDREAEYESVLVAMEPGRFSPGALATAVKMAAPRRRGIHVLVPITVPASAPLDGEMPEQEAAAIKVISLAKLQGGRRVSGHWEKVRMGQEGHLIVEEARELKARAIIVPLPPRTAGSVFGKTLETVLAERPCRVIIQTDPQARPVVVAKA
jgi:APA family basic amino acid/polyamine antiporter